MPRAVIPNTIPTYAGGQVSGQLPFLLMATSAVGTFPISPVWPTPGNVTDTGYSYDHEAEVPITTLPVVTTPNLPITVDGKQYRVIDIQKNDFFPHIVLRMRRAEAVI